MAKEKITELRLDGESFEGLRKNFDKLLQNLIKNMRDTKSEEASISIKIDVKLLTEFIPNYDEVEGFVTGGRDVKKPVFTHKITSAIQVKDDVNGIDNSGKELVWDDETKQWILQPIVGGEQMTINDIVRESTQDEPEGDKEIPEEWQGRIMGPTEDDAMWTTQDADDGETEYTYDDPEDEE